MNHRMGDRLAVDLPVTVYTVDHGPVAGRLLNLSLSGAGIRCRCEMIEDYSVVELGLALYGSDGPEQVRIEGFVVRKHDGLIGLMFMRDQVLLVRRLREQIEHSMQRDVREYQRLR